MALILIEAHIQFCTFVNFFQGLLLLYIDSHPPGQFAAICLIIPNRTDEGQWLHSETEVTLKDVKAPPDIIAVFAVVSDSSEINSLLIACEVCFKVVNWDELRGF